MKSPRVASYRRLWLSGFTSYRLNVCTIFIYHAYSFYVYRFYTCTTFEYRAYSASKLSVFIYNSINFDRFLTLLAFLCWCAVKCQPSKQTKICIIWNFGFYTIMSCCSVCILIKVHLSVESGSTRVTGLPQKCHMKSNSFIQQIMQDSIHDIRRIIKYEGLLALTGITVLKRHISIYTKLVVNRLK